RHATAPTVIYTLSLHDALPISAGRESAWGADARDHAGWPDPALRARHQDCAVRRPDRRGRGWHCPARLAAGPVACRHGAAPGPRSEEHTSELQSRENLVCRLLL